MKDKMMDNVQSWDSYVVEYFLFVFYQGITLRIVYTQILFHLVYKIKHSLKPLFKFSLGTSAF
jgi:hypothetical protein